MRENEFERKVREKMDQLGFEPSESVWVGVDKEINKEKKRRIPLFWLFFVSGVLLAGGAYYFITNKNTAAIIPNKNAENSVAKIPEQETGNKKQVAQPVLPSADPQENSNDEKNGKTETFDQQQPVAGISPINKKPVEYTNGLKTGKNQSRAISTVNAKEISEAGQASAAAGTADIVINNYSGQSAKTETAKDYKKTFDSTAGKITYATTQITSKKDSVKSPTIAKSKEQKKKSSTWKLGYTAGLGSSNLNQNLFNSVKTLSPVVNSNLSAAPAGNTNNSSSEIRPGFSFDAGAFVNRSLSKRVSFSAGINYHYYSTTIRTGIKINTTLVTYNSLSQMITAASYYENGNSQAYTNQYHFIEMPVSVNFQINKSKRIPFNWELGITPGYIVGSKALYYDPNTNVYFNNYLQPNKMQLNAVTAFMIGIPLNKGQLEAGPQVQYGLTGFVNTSDGNPGHLFYAGLKISFIPGKK